MSPSPFHVIHITSDSATIQQDPDWKENIFKLLDSGVECPLIIRDSPIDQKFLNQLLSLKESPKFWKKDWKEGSPVYAYLEGGWNRFTGRDTSYKQNAVYLAIDPIVDILLKLHYGNELWMAETELRKEAKRAKEVTTELETAKTRIAELEADLAAALRSLRMLGQGGDHSNNGTDSPSD
jgi:hypothetical protein